MKSPRFTGFTTNEPPGLVWSIGRVHLFHRQRERRALAWPQLAGRVYAMNFDTLSFSITLAFGFALGFFCDYGYGFTKCHNHYQKVVVKPLVNKLKQIINLLREIAQDEKTPLGLRLMILQAFPKSYAESDPL